MLRFVPSLRWLGLLGAVAVFVVASHLLAQWQWHKHVRRTAEIAAVEVNATRAPTPVAQVTAPDRPLGEDDQFRLVSARGRYDVARELVVRYRSLDGRAGAHVLTPLVTDAGPALLVDRGFVPVTGPATELVRPPAPPRGQVQVLARLRPTETDRGTGGDPASGSIRSIDVAALARALPYPVYAAYADLVRQEPDVAPAPTVVRPPAVDPGPYLSYSLQWYAFAAVAVGAVGYLGWTEARGGRRRRGSRRGGRTGDLPGSRPVLSGSGRDPVPGPPGRPPPAG